MRARGRSREEVGGTHGAYRGVWEVWGYRVVRGVDGKSIYLGVVGVQREIRQLLLRCSRVLSAGDHS